MTRKPQAVALVLVFGLLSGTLAASAQNTPPQPASPAPVEPDAIAQPGNPSQYWEVHRSGSFLTYTRPVFLPRSVSVTIGAPAVKSTEPLGLSLDGDFTLRYTVAKRDIRPEKARVAAQQAILPELVKFYFEAANHRPPGLNDAIPADVQKQAEEASQQMRDLSTPPMTLTLSQHGPSFLYLLMSRRSDAVKAARNEGTRSELVIFDGKQSLSHAFIPNSPFSVIQGLDGQGMEFLPIFCARTQSLHLIQNLTPTGKDTFRGAVLEPGVLMGAEASYYHPLTHIAMKPVDGKSRLSEVDWMSPDGQIARRMSVDSWVLLRNNWVPSVAHMTLFVSDGPEHLTPTSVIDWTLLKAETKADPAQFDPDTYRKHADLPPI